jgi:hypothetical protein
MRRAMEGGSMKRVIVAGLLGVVVLSVWFVVVDGFLGFERSIEMRQLDDERAVYAFLSEHVRTPGRYVCNPEVLPEQRYPGDDPIFSVQYSGMGHADAGQEMLVGLIIMFAAPFVGAMLLAGASSRILSKYSTRLLFFSGIGVVVALFGVMERFGLASYPLGPALALSLHDLAAWVVVGLLVAWLVKPAVQNP